jgi:hypothetical protein
MQAKTLINAIWYHYEQYDAVDAGANDPNDWLDRLRVAFPGELLTG